MFLPLDRFSIFMSEGTRISLSLFCLSCVEEGEKNENVQLCNGQLKRASNFIQTQRFFLQFCLVNDMKEKENLFHFSGKIVHVFIL